MTALELQATKQSLIETIGQIEDQHALDRLKKYLNRLLPRTEAEETISKEEILAGIDAGLKDVKAGRTRPIQELLNELQ